MKQKFGHWLPMAVVLQFGVLAGFELDTPTIAHMVPRKI